MAKATDLSADEMKALNDALTPVIREWLDIFDRHANTKAEKVVYRLVDSGLNMAEHLPLDKKINALVDGSNKILPKLQKYLNDDALAEAIPDELKTPRIAALCDKAGAAPLASLLRKSFAAVAAVPVPAPAAPVDAKPNSPATLVEGFERFRDKYYENGNRLMEKLAKEGANPDFFIINCIDPRNGADIVFDAQPGQQFIDSQMGAIVPSYEQDETHELNASLHYAIDIRKIKHLIIMGHSHCGGCAVLADKTTDPLLDAWVSVAREAREKAEARVGTQNSDALHHETERQVAILSFNNVLEYPMVKAAVQEGRITVSSWFFDMDKGALLEYDPETGDFSQLNKIQAPKQPAPKP